MSLIDYMEKFKNVLTGLIGGATALVAIIEFDNIVPAPIESFNIYGTIILIIGLVLSYVFISAITKKIKLILVLLTLTLLVLIVFQTVFISKVVYDKEYTEYVFHGLETKMPRLEKYTSHEEIIKDIGVDFDSLNIAYENYSYWILLYQFSLLAFLIFFITSIAGVTNMKLQLPSRS